MERIDLLVDGDRRLGYPGRECASLWGEMKEMREITDAAIAIRGGGLLGSVAEADVLEPLAGR